MRFRVERHGGGQPVAACAVAVRHPEGEEARRPAGVVGGAAAGVHRVQEGVAQEGRGVRLGGHEGVPVGGRHLGQVQDDLRPVIGHRGVRLRTHRLTRFRLHSARSTQELKNI